ncbi:MAG: hypothetical protein Kow0080_36550 [Candidatus Promineifilaceae bacterium]
MSETNELICLNCGKSEKEAPLLNIRFNGQMQWICSSCLPILIHRPSQLASKLVGIENVPPGKADH